MVTILVFGILSTVAVWGLGQYASAQAESATAQGLLGALRGAAERAASEGRTYCVSLDTTTTWSTWRYSCDPSDPDYSAGEVTRVETGHTTGSATIAHVSFASWTGNPNDTDPCPAPALGCVDFSLRTTATPGSLQVIRPGTSSYYTLNVEGLTGRVYLQH